MRNLTGKIVVLLFILLISTHLQAQSVAAITGVVADQTGAVVPGATVTLENTETGVTYRTVTNGIGSYTINEVKPGPGYKITFTHAGFKPLAISGIYMNVDATRTQNARLTIGTDQETVQVSAVAENVTLDTTDATVGNNFQVQEMNDLPVENRDTPAALFYQQPGVTDQGAVTGARTDQSNVTLDGLEVNDNATGQFGAIVGTAPVDSVQEFRGVTAASLSSAGQGGGGQFELVTRSGTNSFHGALAEYHRDTDTEANNWFNNNSGASRPPLIRNQFGGDIGGPIWRRKAFFFFDWNSRRDTLSDIEDRTVPLGTNTSGYRGGEVAYVNSAGGITTLSPTQVAALDPQGIGWDQTELSLFQSRYPMANDTTGDVGDLVNTAGYRFNAPFPLVENDYVQRVDLTLNDKMKVFGRGTVANRSATQNAVQFPGDPFTYPFYDKSYAWVVGHTWTIGNNKLNQAEYGETYENYQFLVLYNPQGQDQYGYAGLSGPYGGGNNEQYRTYPIPIVRDDFSWEKGRHSLTFGGTYKWETPNEYAAENYYFPSVGVTGNTNFTALSPNLRPSDINGNYTAIWDSAFSTALGAFADTSANFNYNNKAQVQTQGSGLDLNYRYYETEVYFGDSWKLTPNMTISYGVRYQNYTVPYETRGEQAISNLNTNGTVSTFSWDTFWKDREAQSAAGLSGNNVLPFLQFIYGGKVNNQPSYFQPNNKDFAPRIALAYSPGFDKKTVFNAGAGIVYDHSLINALQFQQLQTSYVFEASNTYLYGTGGDPTASLSSNDPTAGGTPRFGGLTSPPPPPSAPAVVTPYIPFVYSGFPYGLPYGEFNLMMDTSLKTPYSIQLSAGMQHEFPQGYLLKINYVGRLGRRLLATADASQLLDFPDNSGKSNQTMGQAMSGLVTQLRKNVGLGPLGAILAVTPQPWYEDVLTPGVGVANGFASNTQMVAYEAYPYPQRGDFADMTQYLSVIGFPNSILPPNVGMASQFSSNSVWTNKGSSSYGGMLVTLHKNAGYGLQFDLNYTWAHSIDNVSIIANSIAASNGVGFICDVQRPRECRGNSDFDVTNYFNGNFIYELPFGRNKAIAATAPLWLDEVIGGWELSGLPTWHTGIAYNAQANAYVTSFANDAPATLIGSMGAVKTKIHGGQGQSLFAYANSTSADDAFIGPTGFVVGGRNNLRGPGYFNLDLGLGKTFPIWGDKVKLKFRCDAFNAFNHPNFNPPSGAGNDITQAEGVQFGTITGTSTSPGSDVAQRVLQGALRLEF
ncbi:MAG TPA: carboxypeptidase-like regulatory domain-containing protein [Terracidiphilus sp.]|nr:carboxypeptidase-like regulatory domain-containing protein [Terracidiphilus sp.]